MCSSDSVHRREYSGNSGTASRKDAWTSANRFSRGMTISLLGRPDHWAVPITGTNRTPLFLIRHRKQLLPMSAPFDIASHPEERPADLAQRLVAVSADRGHGPVCARWRSSLIQVDGMGPERPGESR